MLAVFFSYVGFIWKKYRVLVSISQSYYRLPKNLQILFTLFCWGFAFPAMIIGSNGLMFFSGGAICFVGAAAAFQEELTHIVRSNFKSNSNSFSLQIMAYNSCICVVDNNIDAFKSKD
jgi:hypothetical protein